MRATLPNPPRRPIATAWRSAYLVIAYLAGKMDVARQQLEALQLEKLRRENFPAGVDGSFAHAA